MADIPLTTIPRARAGLSRGRAKRDGQDESPVGNGALARFERGAPKKADHTAISFGVRDIVGAIRELEGRGAVFHDYDLPGLKTVNHLCVLGSEKAAWFGDTEGNILCLHEDLA